MCGILGYIGQRPAAGILIEGLKRLEYRGYDSAGIAVYQDDAIVVARAKGKIRVLEERIAGTDFHGTAGIGHTRWATHGRPSDENAHPHRSESVVVVHNGIIENHLELRSRLEAEGVRFDSETDTEIIPKLIESHIRAGGGIEAAVSRALGEIEGSFSLAIFCSREPDRILAAKNASPLILGIGEGENFVASDIPALLEHTRRILVLEDGEMAVIRRDGWSLRRFDGTPVDRQPKTVEWSRVMAEKSGFKHFMLKEIYEQPQALADTLRGRLMETKNDISLDGVRLTTERVAALERVVMVACGTSYHAALTGKFWIERFARIPVEVDLASEFRYRNPVVSNNTLVIPISQSGETADTLAALEECRRAGAPILSVCNVVDSSIARRSDDVLYTHAGPEIGVASTKAFTTQLAALGLIALYLGRRRGGLGDDELRGHIRSLIGLPSLAEQCVGAAEKIRSIAQDYHRRDKFFFLGRGTSFPIALEGALKLKEISYIFAEGFPAGEIKHGPIALIDEGTPVVALASGGPTYAKMRSNIEEVLARGAEIIAVVSRGDDGLMRRAKAAIELPEADDFMRPVLEVIPLQLLAYFIADLRGTDVDQPRNLAKSVTVE